MDNGGSNRITLQVSIWHVALLLVIQILALGVAYGRLSQGQDDTRKDVVRIEQQRIVSKDEFDDWKVLITERMNRMEGKIDALVGLGNK